MSPHVVWVYEVATGNLGVAEGEAIYPLIGGPLTTYQIVLRASWNVCGLSPYRKRYKRGGIYKHVAHIREKGKEF